MTETTVKKNTERVAISQRIISLFKIFLINEILLLGIFYTVMHGGILLIPNAIFWDDWVLYRTPPSIILGTFRQVGAMFNLVGYLHVYMLNIGAWSYKVLTFLMMFASGVLLNSILARNAQLTKENRFFVVLLFLVLPFNLARVAIIDFPYVLCHFLFFLAWYLMDRHRIAALLLFFLSFNTNSLLVFYVLPILDMAYRGGHLLSPRSLFSFARRHLEFLLLPFLFFFIKIEFFSPFGMYASYNQNYSLLDIHYMIKAQIKDIENLRINPYVSLLVMPFVFLIVRAKTGLLELHESNTYLNQRLFRVLAIGISAAILGVFPYWVVGHVPTFNEWTSRHQLLLPFGTALIIVAFLSLSKKPIKTIGLSLVISGSLSYGIVNYYSFLIDWDKQKALIELFSKNSTIENSKLVIIKDETKHLNAIDRNYRFYEWNGLLEQAYGNQNHFGIEPSEITQYRDGSLDKFFSSHYKAASHQRNETVSAVLVEIRQAEKDRAINSFVNVGFSGLVLSVSPLDLNNQLDRLNEVSGK